MSEAIAQWWRRRKWGARLVVGATIALAWVGATWLMFLFYIISFDCCSTSSLPSPGSVWGIAT